MSENTFETIARLEKLAAWHRINAESGGADWVWEARVPAAEDLERQADKIRLQLSPGDSVKRDRRFVGRWREAPDEIPDIIAVSDRE